MGMEGTLFHKIVLSLGTLRGEDLLTLGQLVLDIQVQMPANPEFKGKGFSADAEFSSAQTEEETLSFNSIKEAIGSLNPAEIQVLDTLVAWNLDKTHMSRSHQTFPSLIGCKFLRSWRRKNPLKVVTEHRPQY
jgi:hypothetical protein